MNASDYYFVTDLVLDADPDAVAFTGALLNPFDLSPWPETHAIVVALCFILHIAERIARERLSAIRLGLSGPMGGVLEGATIGVVWILAIAASSRGGDFIYFQF